MALINGALQIGRSAITTAQAALAVTGNNMANAATPGYSRQNVLLAPTQYTEVMPGKYTGTGVTLYDVRRQVDAALNARIRSAVSNSSSNMVQQQAMSRVEAAFNELTEEDLSSRLNAFFGSWSALQSQPQDIASRNIVLQRGGGLTNYVRELRSELTNIQSDLDAQVRYQVPEANAIADQVAKLNHFVVTAESGRGGSAAALRDQRDELLKQLSDLINITTREAEGGSVNVFIGNEPLIQYSDNRGLAYTEKRDLNGEKLAQVVFADNNEAISLTGGKIHGLITARDDKLAGVINDLDSWTTSLIFEVNKLHSLGSSLEKFDAEVVATYEVDDPDVSLADMTATGLPWQVENGVFYVHVYDTNGDVHTEQIQVRIGIDATDDTLNNLKDKLNAVTGIQASVDGANRLHINVTDAGSTFSFSAPADADSASNVLAALGINTFFEGTNAVDIQIKSDLARKPQKIAAGSNGLSGNGEMAGQIAQLASTGASTLNGVSISEQFSSMISQVAIDTRNIQDNYTAADVVVQTLEVERQSISGVSMDEEAMKMIIFQRAFQGAARYISLIDRMLDEVLSLI